jgi:hypothetical protein
MEPLGLSCGSYKKHPNAFVTKHVGFEPFLATMREI